jgi:hypothetical protein
MMYRFTSIYYLFFGHYLVFWVENPMFHDHRKSKIGARHTPLIFMTPGCMYIIYFMLLGYVLGEGSFGSTFEGTFKNSTM